jgi:hypothetical protein
MPKAFAPWVAAFFWAIHGTSSVKAHIYTRKERTRQQNLAGFVNHLPIHKIGINRVKIKVDITTIIAIAHKFSGFIRIYRLGRLLSYG